MIKRGFDCLLAGIRGIGRVNREHDVRPRIAGAENPCELEVRTVFLEPNNIWLGLWVDGQADVKLCHVAIPL